MAAIIIHLIQSVTNAMLQKITTDIDIVTESLLSTGWFQEWIRV